MAMAFAGLALGVSLARAQDSSALYAAQPAAANASMQQLPYGVSQIVQLEQAKVGDETIIAYIKNSGSSYRLDADQIIYLRQQGISDGVITTMLNQPKPAVRRHAHHTRATADGCVRRCRSADAHACPDGDVCSSRAPTTYYYYQPVLLSLLLIRRYAVLSGGVAFLRLGRGGYYRRGGYYGGWHGGGYGGWHGGGGWHTKNSVDWRGGGAHEQNRSTTLFARGEYPMA